MSERKEKIKRIIASKEKKDSYHYYCDLCLKHGEIRKSTRSPSFNGKIIDVCEYHYEIIEIIKKRKPFASKFNNRQDLVKWTFDSLKK